MDSDRKKAWTLSGTRGQEVAGELLDVLLSALRPIICATKVDNFFLYVVQNLSEHIKKPTEGLAD